MKKLSASDILSDIVTRYSKEQSYLLLQNIDNTLVSPSSDEDIMSYVSLLSYHIKSFVALFTDEFDTLSTEVIGAKSHTKLMEKKVEQLETRVGAMHVNAGQDAVQFEKTKFLSNEVENLRQ